MITQETGFFTKLKSPMQCCYENPVSAFGAGRYDQETGFSVRLNVKCGVLGKNQFLSHGLAYI